MSATLSQLAPASTMATVTSASLPISNLGDVKAVASTVLTPEAQNKVAGYAMGAAVGAAVIAFLVIFAVAWIVLFTFKPKWVQYCNKGEEAPCEGAPADPARCFVGALIIALIFLVIGWLVKACR